MPPAPMVWTLAPTCVVVELDPPDLAPDLALELEVLALPHGRTIGVWLDSRNGNVLGMVGAGLA